MRALRLGAAISSAAIALLAATTVLAGPVQAAAPSVRDTSAVPGAVGQLSDGGFETPVVSSGSFSEYADGQSLGAWSVGGSVDLNSGRQWQAADGDQSLDLNGDAPGSVSQTLSTLPLTTYVVTYDLAGNPDSGPAVKTGALRVNGAVLQNFTFDTTGRSRAAMGYVRRTAEFTTLLDTSVTLTFAGTNPGAYGPVIDAVHVDGCLLVLCPAVARR
jgi:choice-of-anchor C domain-containing protein